MMKIKLLTPIFKFLTHPLLQTVGGLKVLLKCIIKCKPFRNICLVECSTVFVTFICCIKVEKSEIPELLRIPK